jgi:anti-sigma factor ChrR (cupin superfamily)
LPVLTTVGGAFAAEAAFQRYSVLAVEYARASAELGRLLRDRRSGAAPDAAEGDALVAAAERVISQQNEAWMARGLAVAETLVTLPAPSKAKPDAA